MWPAENRDSLKAFYGPFELRADGFPTAAWEARNLTRIVPPYPLAAAWDPAIRLTRLRCHREVAGSLKRILQAVLVNYGSAAGVQDARMHLCGGAYNFRRIAGSARLSMHAYGAAIDLDPERNPLGTPWRADVGMMPMQVVQIFEAEGWKWGGRFQGRKDCMHFQATG